MKVTYTSGNVVFEKDCSTRKDAMEFIGSLVEIFTGEPCGCCKSKNTAPGFRKMNDGRKFYEMKCLDCTATLQVVALDNGNMFIGRKDRDKALKPNNGWSIYGGGEGSSSPSRSDGKQEEIPF